MLQKDIMATPKAHEGGHCDGEERIRRRLPDVRTQQVRVIWHMFENINEQEGTRGLQNIRAGMSLEGCHTVITKLIDRIVGIDTPGMPPLVRFKKCDREEAGSRTNIDDFAPVKAPLFKATL